MEPEAIITWVLTGCLVVGLSRDGETPLAEQTPTYLITHACALSTGAEPKAILPKKEKLKRRREQWLQSKFVLIL